MTERVGVWFFSLSTDNNKNKMSLPVLPIVLYAGAINGLGYGAFWYDKQQALNRGWRVSESALCMTALAGGWIGGWAAIEQFRHKTQKESFRAKYSASTLVNIVGAGVLAFSPAARRVVLANPIIKNMLSGGNGSSGAGKSGAGGASAAARSHPNQPTHTRPNKRR